MINKVYSDIMHRHTREETNPLSAQRACLRSLDEFERTGAADTGIATRSELGIHNVDKTNDALVFAFLCQPSFARHGLHRTRAVEIPWHGSREKDEVVLRGKLQPQTSRRPLRRKPDSNTRHTGNRIPRQTLDIINGQRHILYFQIRAVNAPLRPESEVISFSVNIHKRLAVAVDALGLRVERNVEAQIHAAQQYKFMLLLSHRKLKLNFKNQIHANFKTQTESNLNLKRKHIQTEI